MLRRTASGITLTLLLIGMLTLTFNIQPVKTEPAIIIVPNDYSTIQEAINNASDGGIIYVRNGTYHEHVVVNKAVSLVGENRSTAIIDGNGTGNVVYVTAHDVNLTGFTIRNSGGYRHGGVYLKFSYYSNISRNIIIDNYDGIILDQSRDCVLTQNVVKNSWVDGIVLSSSYRNRIENNEIRNSDNMGIELNLHSRCNIINRNNLTGNAVGIGGGDSYQNSIYQNLVNRNGQGIWFQHSKQDLIVENLVIRNAFIGIWLIDCQEDHIYHNNFINNTPNRAVDVDSVDNAWDDGYPSGGNYWSNYVGADANGDGIGDTPYVINLDNQDRYPLMNLWGTGVPVADFTWIPPILRVNRLVTFDASDSMPIGGTFTSFVWDFRDGGNATGQIVTHKYSIPGTYVVMLNVTDSEGLWNMENKRIQVAPVVNATIGIHPHILNLQIKDIRVDCYIELPEGCNVSDIDISTIMVNDIIPVDLTAPVEVGDYDNDTILDLMVTFNGTEIVRYILSKGIIRGNVTLTLTGKLREAEWFEGIDTIKVSALIGDVNCDGKVDIYDAVIGFAAYGSTLEDPNWNPNADFVPPYGTIDLYDIVMLAYHYGEKYP